jgi:hypothetical protein
MSQKYGERNEIPVEKEFLSVQNKCSDHGLEQKIIVFIALEKKKKF